jgi:hypothetical protein
MNDSMSTRVPAAVDVLLPVRSPAPFLPEALEGLKIQTMPSWRLVAVIHGDASQVAPVIAQAVPTALVLNADAKATLVDVLNLGLSHCTAPLVARLDADDIPEPNRFHAQEDFLDAHPQVALVGSLYRRIDETGALIDTEAFTYFTGSVVNTLLWRNIIAHPTVMARRHVLVSLGGYRPDATHAEDYDLWMRVASQWDVDVLPEALLRYRIHPDQVTQTKAIPHHARRAIGRARRTLARSRGKSVLSAQLRQVVWAAPQWIRAVQRRLP